jgi:hypothetical protein
VTHVSVVVMFLVSVYFQALHAKRFYVTEGNNPLKVLGLTIWVVVQQTNFTIQEIL